MFRLYIAAFAVLLAGCPADGPADPIDMSAGDMNGSDADEQGLSLDAITPDEGPVEGGTRVTLTGRGFAEGMTVRFGSTAAVDADVESDGEATATTPESMTAGAVSVVVENPDGETDSLSGGFTFTGDVGRMVDFCQLQAQSPTASVSTVASGALYAYAFVEGVTNGAGPGAGIEAELGWGTGGDPSTFDFVAMAYNVDLDGLTAGDLANDEYGGSLTIPDAGSYQYAARFRVDGGGWTYCDLDGSENGTSEDQLGIIDVVELGEPVDGCNLQFPHIVDNAVTGATRTFFGRVTEAGITGGATQHPTVLGELFVGPVGADPSADFSPFNSVPARVSPNAIDTSPDEDEYVAAFAPQSDGEYVFGFRFSADGGNNWTYCGLQDDESPSNMFAATQLGSLTAAGTPDTIDYCHVWQDTLSDDADGATLPTVTVEVFEDPLTVANGGANSAQLEVEAAAIALEDNPALASAAWNPLPYKDLRPGEPNNYEYEGAPYTMATHPPAGTYNVVARVRAVGTSTWTYCDIDEAAASFRLTAASRLTITP